MRMAALIVASICICVGQVVQPGTAAVSNLIYGTVKGADGSNITSGLVTAVRAAVDATPRIGRTTASTAILANGTFRFPALVDGTYQICTQTPGTEWLGSCEWGSNGNITVLSSNQLFVPVSIVLRKGALVSIRVNDSGQLLAANEGKVSGAHLILGVDTDAHVFRPAAVATRDSEGRIYQVLIPYDRPVRIPFGSGFFKLTDAAGTPLPNLGGTVPVVVASGQPGPTIVLNISGTLK